MRGPHPWAGAVAPTDDERLARVALGRLGEPGAPKLAVSVAQMGAARVYELLREGEQPGARAENPELVQDVAVRLSGTNPHRDLELAERHGIRFVIPGDP
jgi:DNA processing protein